MALPTAHVRNLTLILGSSLSPSSTSNPLACVRCWVNVCEMKKCRHLCESQCGSSLERVIFFELCTLLCIHTPTPFSGLSLLPFLHVFEAYSSPLKGSNFRLFKEGPMALSGTLTPDIMRRFGSLLSSHIFKFYSSHASYLSFHHQHTYMSNLCDPDENSLFWKELTEKGALKQSSPPRFSQASSKWLPRLIKQTRQAEAPNQS